MEAKKRQLAAQNNKAAAAVRVNLPEQVDAGRARDHAAKAVGVSGTGPLKHPAGWPGSRWLRFLLMAWAWTSAG